MYCIHRNYFTHSNVHIETRVSELGGDQDLKFTVILSACDLAFALLSKDSVLVGANKDELRKLYSVLLDFVHSFDGMLHDLVNFNINLVPQLCNYE